ncbi:MAG: hypothetical protein U5J95_02365 [Balneolaceae bacterium]|nr:hypothetical protein [Balneolaceae bacterium]
MKITEFDRDEVLSDFLTDYLDGNLEKVEVNSFEGFLKMNPTEKEFAQKAAKGKKALEFMRKHTKNSRQLA